MIIDLFCIWSQFSVYERLQEVFAIDRNLSEHPAVYVDFFLSVSWSTAHPLRNHMHEWKPIIFMVVGVLLFFFSYLVIDLWEEMFFPPFSFFIIWLVFDSLKAWMSLIVLLSEVLIKYNDSSYFWFNLLSRTWTVLVFPVMSSEGKALQPLSKFSTEKKYIFYDLTNKPIMSNRILLPVP